MLRPVLMLVGAIDAAHQPQRIAFHVLPRLYLYSLVNSLVTSNMLKINWYVSR